MSLLFLKILIFTFCLLVVGVCLKLVYNLMAPAWQRKRDLTHFSALIEKKIYSTLTVLRALQDYIRPNFQNVHPAKKIKAKPKNLFRALDMMLEQDAGSRLMLLLGNSGTGKTSFILNYYLHNQTKPEHSRHNICVVRLGCQNAAAVITESARHDSILFLDGLDEDPKAFDAPHQRLSELIRLSRDYKRVLFTCHLNFMPQIKKMPVRPGYEIVKATGKKTDTFFELKKFYLSAMGKTVARKIIHSGLSAWKSGIGKEILDHITANPSLGITPLTLKYLNAVYQENPDITTRNDLYRAIIDIGVHHEKQWKDADVLKRFLGYLAIDIYTRRHQREQEAIKADELVKKATAWKIDLHAFSNNENALIHQTPSGLTHFAHRSFMEFLFIRQLVTGNKACVNVPLSDTMKLFLFDILEKDKSGHLGPELQWLSRFRLTARGTKSGQDTPPNLFKRIVSQNSAYRFLDHLDQLFENPIFFEFGWDPPLAEHLKKAVLQSKTSLLKMIKKRMVVQIDPQKIEIKRQDRMPQKILINQKDFEEYIRLQENPAMTALNRRLGMAGLRMVNTINKSPKIAVLPDLKNPQGFTLSFLLHR